MAAIDKTYGTLEQSQQLWDWLARHRPKFLRFHYGVESYGHLDPGQERPLINTPTSADKWLARHCPLHFVLDRIVEVYSPDHPASQWARKEQEKRK